MKPRSELTARLVFLAIAAAAFAAAGRAQSLPPEFVVEPIAGGWSLPVGVSFIDGHRLLVVEKAGKLWFVEDDVKRNLVLDLQTEVLNNGDRGLIDVAADPQFASNGYIYLLLAVDPTLDDRDDDLETFARLVRYTTSYAQGSLTADPSSRLDLLGDRWSTGFPSCQYGHTVGTLRFLSDGSLVCTAGDGAHFEFTDAGGQDPGCFGDGRFSLDQDLGAFRAQYLATLAGKVLRVDPATGLGLPDNPFFTGDAGDARSRVWLFGLRNPFKFTLAPGSGARETLFLSDVGWNTWEEIDCGRGGENFGWPCYEGDAVEPSYQAADALQFCTSGTFTPPILSWNHTDPGSLGFTGSCATGIEFYRGTSYPPVYHGALFFCDFTAGWMKVATLDANQQITAVLPFASDLHYPVDLTTDPASGDLVYIALDGSRVLRIRYLGPRSAAAASAPGPNSSR
ncbi:MAG: PQQ-dependent sugar dehydrogenase [Planctomycetota bacterium]